MGMKMKMKMKISHAAKGAAFWQKKQVLLHSASVRPSWAGMLFHESSDTVTSGRFALVFFPLGLVAVYSLEEEQRRGSENGVGEMGGLRG